MSHDTYDSAFLDTLKIKILRALEDGAEPLAAFDADGTLWANDIGEDFFKYQIKNNLVTNLPENPIEYYKKIYNSGRTDLALSWIAQINKGKTLPVLRKETHSFISEFHNLPIFDLQKDLITFLKKQNVEVYVVTASMKWAVEPAAKLLDIDNEHVLGIECLIENNIITDQVKQPITWREGKALNFLNHSQNKKPMLCSGNTMGDLALLELASHIRLTKNSAQKGESTFETEQELKRTAEKNNWLIYSYGTNK